MRHIQSVIASIPTRVRKRPPSHTSTAASSALLRHSDRDSSCLRTFSAPYTRASRFYSSQDGDIAHTKESSGAAVGAADAQLEPPTKVDQTQVQAGESVTAYFKRLVEQSAVSNRKSSYKDRKKAVKKIVRGKGKEALLALQQLQNAGTPAKKKLRHARKRSQVRRVQTDVEDKDTKMEANNTEVGNPSALRELKTQDLDIERLSLDKRDVPPLAHDLDRVLFNPGVYALQDPRSRVYNFDPYLEKVMPVQDFNFDAVTPFVTSSNDTSMTALAARHGKKYTCSSSSVTSVMNQFHRLLSHKRDIDVSRLTRDWMDFQQKQPTIFYKSPASAVLRWKDGTYAIDADKEFDRDNILSKLGHLMEKLLTLPKDEFEQYRKSATAPHMPEREPETYQYSKIGDFLMRSQLDAYDPRLPGSGIFDVKTRAVHPIRMDLDNYKPHVDYHIRQRTGQWESFEREVYDLMRGTMFKYALQVRVGNMDGVFIAYHNIERIFGFQYLGLDEMDQALHGSSSPEIGNAEFKITMGLLEDVFARATEKFPGQSIRLFFDADPTVDASHRTAISEQTEKYNPSSSRRLSGNEKSERQKETGRKKTTKKFTGRTGFMRIFAQPYSEEELEAINAAKARRSEEFEKRLMNTWTEDERAAEDADTPSPQSFSSYKDKLAREIESSDRPLVGWTLEILNHVNNKPVGRVTHLERESDYTLTYALEEMAEPMKAYKSCRLRRAEATPFGDDLAVPPGLRQHRQRLKALTEKSRKWREEQDLKDEGKETFVWKSGEVKDLIKKMGGLGAEAGEDSTPA